MPQMQASARSLSLFASLVLATACGGRPATEPIDWMDVDDWSVHVVTEDADGDLRVTRIWVGVVDGAGMIRTQRSRWRENLERGSPCWLRVGGIDYPVNVEFVTDPELRRRTDLAFLTKYGWQERLVIEENRAQSDDPYMRLTTR